MAETIKNLEPKIVWKNFYEYTQIPHPSHHEEKAVAYLKAFGENLGLETIVDEVGNVIIRKPATPGMEDRKGLILQAHIDMVPQKNSNINHDFEKDPIDAYDDGTGWVRAKDTTLGADNGMGLAAMLAVLESKDIKHGPIEALFTATEETGMDGANGLKAGIIKGDILLNLDSEDEGELYIGCAGGIDANVEFEFKKEAVPADYTTFQIYIKGLKGGHSGMDIHLGRGNANKILFRYLNIIKDRWQAELSDVLAGSLRNAIPREAFATVLIPNKHKEDIKTCVKKYEAVVKNELSEVEPDLEIGIKEAPKAEFIMDKKSQLNLILSVIACQNGVIRMSTSMAGLVETSSNLAIVKTIDNKVIVQCLLRSSVDSSKDALAASIKACFDLAGAKVSLDGAYPGWKPNVNSEILILAQELYKKHFNKEAKIMAVHAGLECGILGATYPNWDMISIGPTIRSPHSPDERVNIESVGKFFDFLKLIIENAPKK
ncbi:aminoacyl-histidine dipeptidase [Odoribacter sp. OttesenSCG-928-L07]|nr:aminoacyl-histidine dipeptidase [Odoribacter sp. OttesenSCG-928-L07]MDL2238660.1 aminoacyl-histidine dipeptidase [Bacteroidales bacterium OttesenSCG-928-L14]MDL2240295.1 aminoacyl-histidine dipeptidase [Bacteroidales bacterium OttesenSCG-928-K22]